MKNNYLVTFWKTYRLKELYKKGKYVVDLKTKAAIYALVHLIKMN